MMTSHVLDAAFPAIAWLAAALLCLLLEAAGTPVGARKRGRRTHLPWIIALAGGVVVIHAVFTWARAAESMTGAGLVFDRPGLLASALVAALVVVTHLAATPGLREIDEERGEQSAGFAVLGAAFSLVTVAVDLIVLAAALSLAAAALALVAAPDRDGPHGIEAATKGVVGAGFVLVVLSLAAFFTWASAGDTSLVALGRGLMTGSDLAPVALVLVTVSLALLVGAVPLHQVFVDTAHGSAPASGALLTGGALLAASTVTLRLAEVVVSTGEAPRLATAWAVLAVLTLIGAPIAALDQSRVARVVAYLAVVPGGVVLAACAASALTESGSLVAWRAGAGAAVAGTLGVAAAMLGTAVPRLDAASSWEDWAGVGRKHPVMAALLVYAIGTLVGVPGTVGFAARLAVARACFDVDLDLLGLAVIATAAVGAAPLVRLALFVFAKDPPPRAARPPSGLSLVVGAALLVVLGTVLTVLPGLLEGLLRSTTAGVAG